MPQGGSRQEAAEERIEDYLLIDPMEMEIGVGLIRLADPKRGGDLLPRITGVRQGVAADIGIILPKVRIRDNMPLGENQYRIKIANNPVAVGEVYPGKLLAMDSGTTSGKIAGIETQRPRLQPAGGLDRSRACGREPRCSATRRSSRRPCWRRTCRRSSAAMPTSCSLATPPST